MQGVQVQSLIRDLRFHMPWRPKIPNQPPLIRDARDARAGRALGNHPIHLCSYSGGYWSMEGGDHVEDWEQAPDSHTELPPI